MNRLAAFGCSFTYGHGLLDCSKPDGGPGNEPSQQAWPRVLADSLGMEVYNNSAPGASNLEILHRIVKSSFNSTDTVIILWSFIERDFIFKKQSNGADGIKVYWAEKDLFKHWALTHDLEDMGTRSWFYIQHADLYIKSYGARCFHFSIKPIDYLRFKPNYINININSSVNGYAMLEMDRALDGNHPGPRAHTDMANEIRKVIDGNS